MKVKAVRTYLLVKPTLFFEETVAVKDRRGDVDGRFRFDFDRGFP